MFNSLQNLPPEYKNLKGWLIVAVLMPYSFLMFDAAFYDGKSINITCDKLSTVFLECYPILPLGGPDLINLLISLIFSLSTMLFIFYRYIK